MARDWLIAVADVDPDDPQQPGVVRSYLVSEGTAEAVMDLLGDPFETTLMGDRAKQAALDAYDEGVHL